MRLGERPQTSNYTCVLRSQIEELTQQREEGRPHPGQGLRSAMNLTTLTRLVVCGICLRARH